MSGIVGGGDLKNFWGTRSGILGQRELEYEEGSWTPTGTGVTSANGKYQKIGKMVFCSCFVSIDSGPNNDEITGLPFTVAAASGSKGSGVASYVSGTSETIAINPSNSATNFRMYYGGTRFTITNGNNFYGAFTYFKD